MTFLGSKMKLFPYLLTSLFVGGSFAQEVLTNDAGYDFDQPKTAIYKQKGAEVPTAYRLVSLPTQQVVAQGVPYALESVSDWSGFGGFAKIDFSEVTLEGNYRVEVDVGIETYLSTQFSIGENALIDKTFPSLLDFFYQSRADETSVWSADQGVKKVGGTTSYDVRGGWYDASGDISKYLSHLHFGNYTTPQQIPMTAWVMADLGENSSEYLIDRGHYDKVISEGLWGADYLMRVLDAEGYFFTNVFDNWTGTLSARQICAFEGSAGTKTADYQSAFREGGGVSIAALARMSQWQSSGGFTSAEYLAGAEKAYAHIKTYNTTYADDGVENIIDDYTALLAASELYKATSNSAYLDDARIRMSNMKSKLDASGYFWADVAKTRPYYHAAEAGLPLIALARYVEVEGTASYKDQAIAMIKSNLEYQVSVSSEVNNPFGYARQHIKTGGSVKTSFFIPRDNETGYWWQGESARQASLSAAVARAGKLVYGTTIPQNLKSFARDQLDWIMGKNPYNVSMFSGIGDNNPPKYNNDSKMPLHGHLDGGISNGITASSTNGSGISWNPSEVLVQGWENWRWVEQWLPHSTWFIMAVGSWQEFNEQLTPSFEKKLVEPREINFSNGQLIHNVEKGQDILVLNLKGEVIKKLTSQGPNSALELVLNKGVWIVSTSTGSSRIMIK
jgi:hypothetical protein